MSTLKILIILALILTVVGVVGSVFVLRKAWPVFQDFLSEARRD